MPPAAPSLRCWRCLCIFYTLFSAVFLPHVTASTADANETVTWKFPNTSGSTYNAVDMLNASWTSNLDYNPYLVVWCKTPSGWSTNETGSVPPSSWHLIGLNLDLSIPYPISCHLDFEDQKHIALQFDHVNSASFNITDVADTVPKIVGPSASTAAPSATPSNTNVAGGVVVQSDSSASSSGLSAGAIAGIVISVVLGLGIVLWALWFLCLRKRRRDQAKGALGYFVNKLGTKNDDLSDPSGGQPVIIRETSTDWKQPGILPELNDNVIQKLPAELPMDGEPYEPPELEGSGSITDRL